MPESYEIYRPTGRREPDGDWPAETTDAALVLPPATDPDQSRPRPAVRGPCGWPGGGYGHAWVPGLICVAIWLATGAGYFWPIWVILGTGVPALIGLAHAVPHRAAPKKLGAAAGVSGHLRRHHRH